jgi:hypothetical protein
MLNSHPFYIFNKIIFLIVIAGGAVQLGPLGTAATNIPIVPAPGDYDNGEIGGMKIGRGNRSTWRKTCLSAALSITNPTCCQDVNPGRRGGKPANNRLSYGTTYIFNNSKICLGERGSIVG